MLKHTDKSLSEEEIKKISSEHIKNVDKWYRMYAGLASKLERYDNGIIYLNIENTEKQLPSNYATALKFVRCWVKFNKELSEAKGFVVFFYTTKSTGFALSSSDLEDEGKIKDAVEKINLSKEEKPELISVFSGLV